VTTIAAVMIHVADVPSALAWYEQAFPECRRAIVRDFDGSDFEHLRLGDLQIEIVPADAKVGAGAAGSVVYWRVADFDAALARLQALGATLYRGPGAIEDGESMCQLRDPWGNCIGLRGPRAAA